MFCGAVHEFHMCLVLVTDKSDWTNIEEDIWAGVINDPLVAASSTTPMLRRTQSQTPVAEKSAASSPPFTPELEGMAPLKTWL